MGTIAQLKSIENIKLISRLCLIFFREKLRKDVNLTIGIIEKFNEIKTHSYACILPESLLEVYKNIYAHFGIEIDVIDEYLGNLFQVGVLTIE